MTDRIACAALRLRITDADTAAALIRPGETVATSGFTGSGYPKMVPQALARRIAADSTVTRQGGATTPAAFCQSLSFGYFRLIGQARIAKSRQRIHGSA